VHLQWISGRASGNRFAEQANVAEYWYSRNYEIWKTNVPDWRWTIGTARFSRHEYFVTICYRYAMNQYTTLHLITSLFLYFFIFFLLYFFTFSLFISSFLYFFISSSFHFQDYFLILHKHFIYFYNTKYITTIWIFVDI